MGVVSGEELRSLTKSLSQGVSHEESLRSLLRGVEESLTRSLLQGVSGKESVARSPLVGRSLLSCKESLPRSLSTLGVSNCEESLVTRSHLSRGVSRQEESLERARSLLRGVSPEESLARSLLRGVSHWEESHRKESLVTRSCLSQGVSRCKESIARSLS